MQKYTPFRWNIKKIEELGLLLKNDFDPCSTTFIENFLNEIEKIRILIDDKNQPVIFEDFLKCCSRVLSFSGNRDIIFIGRSPENIFDFYSGIFENTSWAQRIKLLNISIYGLFDCKDNIIFEKKFTALKNHFKELKLAPTDIVKHPKGIAFCDLVWEGTTFGKIFEFLISWASEEKIPCMDLKRKIFFLGITPRKKTSPNTNRWQQESTWTRYYNVLKQIKNISIPKPLWFYLGNMQDKTIPCNYFWRWNKEVIHLPQRKEENFQSLKFAYWIYKFGTENKKQFSKLLVKENAIKYIWYRKLINELKFPKKHQNTNRIHMS